MPVAKFQLPDGRVARFEVPDGTTPEQAQAMVAKEFPNLAPQAKGAQKAPDPTGSFLENLAAGTGKAFADLGRGLRQINASTGVPTREQVAPTWEQTKQNMGAGIAALEGDAAESRRLDAPLMRTGGGVTGNIAGNIAATLPAMALPGAATYTGAATIGGLLGALQPTTEGESRLSNTAVGTAFGVAGKAGADKIISSVAKRQASGVAAKAANQMRDASLETSRKAGYVVPPTQANPGSAWNQILEGFSGKIKTSQAASVKNQEVTNRLAKQAIGIADDAPLSKPALKAVRDAAGQAYDDVAKFGTYTTDATLKRQIDALASAQRTLAKDMPGLARKDVIDIAKQLDQPYFEGQTVVELTKALRERAGQAFKEGATDAGRFYRGASDAIEDLIERNLMQAKQPGLEAFRAARQTIAKAHTIEAALNETTGNVIGAKLAAQLAKGKPLSGSLKEAASFARAFPKAAQEVERTGAALATSPLDWAAMGTIGALTQNPLMLAGVAARPAARSMILSAPYQAAMTTPRYGAGTGARTIAELLGRPAVRRAIPGTAAGAASLVYAE